MTLADVFGVELSIVQAPMAGVQAHDMTVAVSNAGGLGSLPCAMLNPAALKGELEQIRRKTARPYLLNFFCHEPPVSDDARAAKWRRALAPYYAEYGIDASAVPAGPGRAPFDHAFADVLEQSPPPVVSFHFGLPPAELLSRVRAWGTKIIGCATSVEEAVWLEARGVDAIVAQGFEAGGHHGCFLGDPSSLTGTFALVRRIVGAVEVPVIAAGGIADARGVAAAMALGAAGVQVGTAFLLCSEATTSAVHRAALQGAAAQHTMLTNVFTGRLARGILNRLMRELGPVSECVMEFPLAASALAPLRAAAEKTGSGDFSPLWCGQNATGCKAIPAAELLIELADGLRSST